MASNRSAPTAAVVPVLIYDDVSQAIDWLVGAFGFNERLRAPDRNGQVTHAQLHISDGAVMLGHFGSIFHLPRSREISQYVIVHVDDVDEHFERAKAFGATIIQPPMDQPFGERQYAAEDLAGHLWTFSQHVADVEPAVWGAIEARTT